MSVPRVRILADDLTGALDCAVCFTGDVGPIRVRWDMRAPGGDSFALSSETRELSREEAAERVARMARALPGERAGLVFKKVDSLLRGHEAAEIAAMMRGGAFARAVFAPAFPQRGRIMRKGRQYVRTDAGADPVAADIGAELRALGINTFAEASGSPGVWIADAESDADLRGVVARGRAMGHPLLWCGTAGLAAALADAPPRIATPADGRMLVVSGSDHPVARAQVAALARARPDAMLGLDAPVAHVEAALRQRGLAILAAELPPSPRTSARATIGRALADLLPALAAPELFVVMGGETLRQSCDAVGAEELTVEAEVEPGIAQARLQDGAWRGTRIISKSGAFGDAGTLLRILGVAALLAPVQDR
jgi:uncharacterized protein YgbK (DUF1537 family)